MIAVFRKAFGYILIVLLLLEMTSRVYLFGWDSFNYFKMRSVHKFRSARLLQRAANPSLPFELKPNLDTYFWRARFRTNSQGLRDREYTIEKPDNTFRVAVLGSSFTMPLGVDGDDAFHSVVERKLNTESNGKKYEFINFAVAGYDNRRAILVLKRKALKFDPDLIMFCTTPRGLIEGKLATHFHGTRREYRDDKVWPIRNGFYKIYSIRLAQLIGGRFENRDGLPTFPEANIWGGKTIVFSDWVEERDILMDPIEELSVIHAERATPVCLVVLGRQTRNNDVEEIIQKALHHDLNVIDTQSAIYGMQHREFCLDKLNCHPSVKAHRTYAEVVYNALKSQDLLKKTSAL